MASRRSAGAPSDDSLRMKPRSPSASACRSTLGFSRNTWRRRRATPNGVRASDASAQSRTLRWARLAVTAHLDADGRLHVQERHSIVFDGDWNGGERIFQPSRENVIDLERHSSDLDLGDRPKLHLPAAGRRQVN